MTKQGHSIPALVAGTILLCAHATVGALIFLFYLVLCLLFPHQEDYS